MTDLLMSVLLYVATAALLLWIVHRTVTRMTLVCSAVLVLFPLCFTGRALLTGGIFAPIDLPYFTEPLRDLRLTLGVPQVHNPMLSDVSAQIIPWRKAVRYALAHGEWPLWNPFILSGTVLAASAQAAVYSPFTLLACLLPIGGGLTYSASITFFVAALGAYLLAREIGCRREVSWIAAAAFMASTPMAFFVLWPLAASWAFLPLVLLGVRRCVVEPGVRSCGFLVVSFTLLLLAGHPETALHVVFIAAIYCVFKLTGHRKQFGAAIGAAVAAGGIALLLSAVYVLPILEIAPQSMEYQNRRDVWSKTPHGVSTSQALARITVDVFPYLDQGAHDLPLDPVAAGSLALAAAIYAVVRWRWRETWFFAALAVFGIVAHAGWAPLANSLQRLPLFDTALNERFSFAGGLALALLAAVGVEEFLRRGADRVMVYVCAATLVMLSAGSMAIMRSGMRMSPFPDWGIYTLFGEIACLALGVLLLLARPQLRVITPVLLVLLLGQRWLAVGDVYPTLPMAMAYPPIPILRSLPDLRQPFRIVAHGYGLVPGTSALYELEDVRGYEALTLKRYAQTYAAWCVYQPVWFNRVEDLTRPFLSFLNVRFAIMEKHVAVPPGWHVIAEQRGSRLVQNERALPRAFIPRHLTVGRETVDHVVAALQKIDDFREAAWIEAPMPKHERQNGEGNVSIWHAPGGFGMDVTMHDAGWVIVSEPAWSGWRAYIDGRRVQMQIANLAFLGIYVPAGHHAIRLVYLPRSFVIGRTISAMTFLTLVVTVMMMRGWRNRVG